MKIVFFFVCCFTACFVKAEDVQLFNGKDLRSWKEPTSPWTVVESLALDASNPKAFTTAPGTGVTMSSAAAKSSNIESQAEFGDCQMHVEFCVPQGSNSGIYVMGRYEVQILDSFGRAEIGVHDCGAIYERWKDNKGYEGHAPRVNASKPAGEWQTFDITFRAPRFDPSGKKIANATFVKVLHNGQVIHENVECIGPTRGSVFENEAPTGPFRIQGDHGPVAYRSLIVSRP